MIGDFELLERDGLARICRFETAHGKVETPAIMPVINPNRKVMSASEMRARFGVDMVITNSYIISRNQELREKALKEGVHGLLDFDGTVMTDSGTFQTHVYSDVSVDPAEILEFQRAIGSDVATVFDVFSEPDFTLGQAENAAAVTAARVKEAMSSKRGGSLIAATVQGGLYPEVREGAARRLGEEAPDYFTIGGVVPLMEEYRFADLASVIIASKKGLPPGRPVHLFGAGHPLMLPLAVLLGCDLFDSASYVKYAYDGRMMFPEGSIALSDLKYSWCDCPVCSSHTPAEMASMDGNERVLSISGHNLYILTSELKRIKQAIHEGSLWSLVEARARSSPQLFDAYAEVLSHSDYLSRFEPMSRRSGINFVDGLSLKRPDFARFFASASGIRPGKGKRLLVVRGERQYFSHYDFTSSDSVEDIASLTNVGIFPIQLTETYPLSQSTYSAAMECAEKPDSYSAKFGYGEWRIADGRWRRMGAGANRPDRLSQALIVCEYQFGRKSAEALLSGDVQCTHSRNTGKLRSVLRDGRQILFFRTEDGLFSVKFHGGELLHGALPKGTMSVECSDDAIPFVSAGKSLFSRFVTDADGALRPGDECLVVDRAGNLLAVGRTMLRKEEMLSFGKGVAVDVREGRSSSASSRQPEDMK